MSRNCPNCGAVIEYDKTQCAYCGTSYFDLSAIDISNTKPFYLQLRQGDSVFVSKVSLAGVTIEQEYNTLECTCLADTTVRIINTPAPMRITIECTTL